MATQDSAKREIAARQRTRFRLALMPNYDGSATQLPPVAGAATTTSSSDIARKLVADATRELVSQSTLQQELEGLRTEFDEKLEELRRAGSLTAKAPTPSVASAPNATGTQRNSPDASSKTPDAATAASTVRVSATTDGTKPAIASRTSSAAVISARCLAHGGEHYFGATSGEVVEAWAEMREQFGMRTPHKVKTRTSFKQWLQKFRRVCADSIHWYGDFVLVRSDASRTTEPREARAEDGWFIFPDPNSDGYLDHALMFEAFDKSTDSLRGPIAELVRPAWISETARLAEASRLGREDSMPFTRGTLDEVRADSLVRGDIR